MNANTSQKQSHDRETKSPRPRQEQRRQNNQNPGRTKEKMQVKDPRVAEGERQHPNQKSKRPRNRNQRRRAQERRESKHLGEKLSMRTEDIVKEVRDDYFAKLKAATELEEQDKRLGRNGSRENAPLDLKELVKHSYKQSDFSDPWSYVAVAVKIGREKEIVFLKTCYYYDDGTEDMVDKSGQWYRLEQDGKIYVASSNGSKPQPPHKTHLKTSATVVGKISF